MSPVGKQLPLVENYLFNLVSPVFKCLQILQFLSKFRILMHIKTTTVKQLQGPSRNNHRIYEWKGTLGGVGEENYNKNSSHKNKINYYIKSINNETVSVKRLYKYQLLLNFLKSGIWTWLLAYLHNTRVALCNTAAIIYILLFKLKLKLGSSSC